MLLEVGGVTVTFPGSMLTVGSEKVESSRIGLNKLMPLEPDAKAVKRMVANMPDPLTPGTDPFSALLM